MENDTITIKTLTSQINELNMRVIMEIVKSKHFANGSVYAIKLNDGAVIETTDTFLPYYTKDAIGRKQNKLTSYDIGSRADRWMIGISTMAGCPVKCKFCATAKIEKARLLTADEIIGQVDTMLLINKQEPIASKEFKINYTRMGEPFMNVENVKKAIGRISEMYPNTHHYVSTIGLKDADYSWIHDNITLQLSIHAMTDERRNELIPISTKAKLEELGKIRTNSKLKTTINITLIDEHDFDINVLRRIFDPQYFFIKLSPLNKNDVAFSNGIENGVIVTTNLI